MEVAISSLVSALLSDYVPIESLSVKIAIGGLLQRAVEKTLSQHIDFSPIVKHLYICHRRRTNNVDVCDWFTAYAINMFIRESMKQQLEENKIIWNYDHVSCAAG